MGLVINLNLPVDRIIFDSNIDDLCGIFEKASQNLNIKQSRLVKNKNKAIYTKWIALRAYPKNVVFCNSHPKI